MGGFAHSPVGIEAIVVEPGSFRIDFLDGSSPHGTTRQSPDYAATVGRVRDAAAANNHRQVNDPANGAAANYAAVIASGPPGRLPLGPDAVAMVKGKLTHVRAELDAWRDLSSSTLVAACLCRMVNSRSCHTTSTGGTSRLIQQRCAVSELR